MLYFLKLNLLYFLNSLYPISRIAQKYSTFPELAKLPVWNDPGGGHLEKLEDDFRHMEHLYEKAGRCLDERV